jgi:hypothetical protein
LEQGPSCFYCREAGHEETTCARYAGFHAYLLERTVGAVAHCLADEIKQATGDPGERRKLLSEKMQALGDRIWSEVVGPGQQERAGS